MFSNQKKEKIILIILLCSLLTLIGIGIPEHGIDSNEVHLIPYVSDSNQKSYGFQALSTHGPITITSNTEFANHPNITGSGTAGDPYIFENYMITTNGVSGIAISNTDVYFIIQHVELTGSTNTNIGAIQLSNVTHGHFTNITVTNSYNGFYLISSSSNVLNNNTASSNSNILSNNTATSNIDDGFYFQSSNSNTLNNNTATSNAQSGFYLSGTSNNFLSNNTAARNKNQGFHVVSSTSNTLNNNTATSNSFTGFFIQSSSSNTLNNNSATGNSGTGFYLFGTGSFNNVLSQNTATSNTQHGFVLDTSSSNNVLNNNMASSNSFNGFLLSSSSSNTLNHNIATSNSQNGFRLADGSNNNSLIGNSGSDNSLDGFYILNSNDNILTRNIAINNSLYGFSIISSNYTLIYYNFVLDNNNNNVQGFDNSSTTSWTNGSHGNYWNDYIGPDSNNDGIGEINYILDGTAISNDTRPLVSTLHITPVMDFDYTEGTTGHMISWRTTSNLLSVMYQILQNNVVITSGSWSNGQSITVNADGLNLGIHNFTIVVSDISMNEAIDTVFVNVTANPSLMTTSASTTPTFTTTSVFPLIPSLAVFFLIAAMITYRRQNRY